MSKVCNNCGATAEDDAIYCKKCGNKLSNDSVCSKHGMEKDEQEKREVDIAEEEACAASNVDRQCNSRKISRPGNRMNLLLNKIILFLIILCIISASAFFILSKYKETAGNIFTGLLPKKQTSSYVLYQMKNIKELQALKLNKADYYHYKDSNNRDAELIIRYYININFNLDDCKITKKGDGSFAVELKKPEINAVLLDGIDYTEKKQPDYYLGIEIFSISKYWETGSDFKMGEITDIAQKYIDDKCTQNAESYINEAFVNIKDKLLAISDKLDLNISEVKMEGVNE